MRARNRTAGIRDAKGRKHCSRGDKCLHPKGPWLPVSEFNRRTATSDGLSWRCRYCARGAKAKRSIWYDCRYCGEPCELEGQRVCNACRNKNMRLAKRKSNGWVIEWSSEPEWKGSWFDVSEVKSMLEDGSWPEDTLMRRTPSGERMRVVGAMLTAQSLEAEG